MLRSSGIAILLLTIGVGSSIARAQAAPEPAAPTAAAPAAPVPAAPTPFLHAAGPVDERIPPLLDAIRAKIAAEPELAGVEIREGGIVVAEPAARREIRIVGSGGALAARVRLARTVRALIEQNAAWKGWLDTNGYALVYRDPPSDAGTLVSIEAADRGPHVTRLLQVVQDRVELDPSLNGVLVLSGTVAGREGLEGQELRVEGRIVEEEQRARIEQIFVEAMASLPYWRDARQTVLVSLRDLQPAPLSEILALQYYAMGLDAFWSGDMSVANAAFTRAVAEKPDSVIFRYWRVVALLATGETARAEEKLRPLVRQTVFGQHSELVAHEFERLQGPLRWQLVDIERNILLTQ